MSKVKYSFYFSASLLLIYYVFTPVFLAVSGLPFISSLLSHTALTYLGLSVVLFLKKTGLPTAVFTLVGALLQISPLVYCITQIFKGLFSFSVAFNLLIALCQIASFLVLTLFALKPKTLLTQRFWFLPIVFCALSFLFYITDLFVLSLLASSVQLLPLIFNIVLFLILCTALSFMAVGYKNCEL